MSTPPIDLGRRSCTSGFGDEQPTAAIASTIRIPRRMTSFQRNNVGSATIQRSLTQQRTSGESWDTASGWLSVRECHSTAAPRPWNMNRQMRTAELRFFMMPDEARDRIRQALPTSGDALYAYPEPRRIVELASANDVNAHIDREWQFFAGAPGLREFSPTDVQPGQLVLLYLPEVDGDALVMADIGVTWDPEHPDAE